MEDIVLVSGVLVIRPPAGRENEKIAKNAIFAARPSSGDEDDEGITCDGVTGFRPSSGKNAEKVPQSGTFEVLSEDDRMIAEDGSME